MRPRDTSLPVPRANLLGEHPTETLAISLLVIRPSGGRTCYSKRGSAAAAPKAPAAGSLRHAHRAPTDTIDEFMGLLLATADAALTEVPLDRLGDLDVGGLLAWQVKLLHSLVKLLSSGRGLAIFGHIAAQTSPTPGLKHRLSAVLDGLCGEVYRIT
jgi:hypothetical protein